MNERIGQLAEQAKQYAEDKQNDPLKIYTLDCFNEKFAELIVRECANELIKWKDEPFPYDPEFGARLIKQHFGVEE